MSGYHLISPEDLTLPDSLEEWSCVLREATRELAVISSSQPDPNYHYAPGEFEERKRQSIARAHARIRACVVAIDALTSGGNS